MRRNNSWEFLSKACRIQAGTAKQGSLHFDSACVKQEKVDSGASSLTPVILKNMSLMGIEHIPY